MPGNWQQPNSWSADLPLRRSLPLIGLAVKSELSTRGLRAWGLAGAIAVGILSWILVGPDSAALLGRWLGLAYACGACLGLAVMATRDLGPEGVYLRARPIRSAVRLAGAWAAGLCVWLLLLAASFLASAPALLFGGGPAGLAAAIPAFLGSALQVATAGTTAFALSRLARGTGGGAVAALFWLVSGIGLIPADLRPDTANNAWLFAFAASVLLAAVLLLVERRGGGTVIRSAGVLVALSLLTPAAEGSVWGSLPGSSAAPGSRRAVWDTAVPPASRGVRSAPGPGLLGAGRAPAPSLGRDSRRMRIEPDGIPHAAGRPTPARRSGSTHRAAVRGGSGGTPWKP